MGCLTFLMFGGFLAALGVYVGAMVGYLAVFFATMALYLSACASAITAFVMWIML